LIILCRKAKIKEKVYKCLLSVKTMLLVRTQSFRRKVSMMILWILRAIGMMHGIEYSTITNQKGFF